MNLERTETEDSRVESTSQSFINFVILLFTLRKPQSKGIDSYRSGRKRTKGVIQHLDLVFSLVLNRLIRFFACEHFCSMGLFLIVFDF